MRVALVFSTEKSKWRRAPRLRWCLQLMGSWDRAGGFLHILGQGGLQRSSEGCLLSLGSCMSYCALMLLSQ